MNLNEASFHAVVSTSHHVCLCLMYLLRVGQSKLFGPKFEGTTAWKAMRMACMGYHALRTRSNVCLWGASYTRVGRAPGTEFIFPRNFLLPILVGKHLHWLNFMGNKFRIYGNLQSTFSRCKTTIPRGWRSGQKASRSNWALPTSSLDDHHRASKT